MATYTPPPGFNVDVDSAHATNEQKSTLNLGAGVDESVVARLGVGRPKCSLIYSVNSNLNILFGVLYMQAVLHEFV